MYGTITKPEDPDAPRVEFYDANDEAWSSYFDIGTVDVASIPASGKDYQLRATLYGEELDVGQGASLTWSLVQNEWETETTVASNIATLTSNGGKAVLKIKPIIGDQSFLVKVTYDPDGDGEAEAKAGVMSVNYSLTTAYGNLYYYFYSGETENTAAVTGVKAGWNGVIPATVTANGKKYDVTQVYSLKQRDPVTGDYKRYQLSTVTIPASVTYVESSAFNEIKGLAAINVDAKNPQYVSVDGVLYDKTYEIWDYSDDEGPSKLIGTGKALVLYPAAKAGSRFEIPADVRYINGGAFQGAGRYSLKDLVIPAGLDLTYNDMWLFRKFITTEGGEFVSWNIKIWSKGNKTIAAHAKKYVNENSDTPALPWAEYTVPTVAVTSKITANLNKNYNTIKVTWSAVSGAAGYEVYYKKGSGAWTSLGTTTSTSLTKSKLSKGAKYQFRVIAYTSANGGEVFKSAAKDSKAVYTLKKLSGVKVKKAKSKVKVSWKNINGETGYQIYKSTKKNKGFKLAKTVKSTKAKSATLKVKKNKKYYYKIRAYKTVNGKKIYGPWSSVKSYTLK